MLLWLSGRIQRVAYLKQKIAEKRKSRFRRVDKQIDGDRDNLA